MVFSMQVIFPPLTMLRVATREGMHDSPPPSAGTPATEIIGWSREKHEVRWGRTEDGRDHERIVVVPSFTG